MSDKKSPLEEAKSSYEQIKQFAEEQAIEQAKIHAAEKLKQLFEDITINISGDGVEVEKDGEVISHTNDSEMGVADMGLDAVETTIGEPSEDSEEFIVSDEDDEISLGEIMDITNEEIIQNQNMEEMNNMAMEQEAAAAAPAPNPAPAAETAPVAEVPGAVAPEAGMAPTEEVPAMPELLTKLDTLINIMLQQNGAPVEGGATAGTEQDFEVIDDEAGAAAPEAGMAPAAPVQEEEIEIIDFEGGEDTNYIDGIEEQMLEIVDEDDMPMAGDAVAETRSLGFASKRTGDKQLKMDTMEKNKGHHAPVTSLKENKAQQESKTDELIKENSSLKKQVKGLQAKEKEFEEAFIDLRTQFNEMQLFNGKLALVNKVLMNGGLTTEEKIKICEQFDSVQTYEEASKLFKTIIKESNIKIASGNDTAKLKSASTNTIKPKSTSEPLYESAEARRAKILAGMIKSEDEE